jgi:xylulokinase
VRTVKLIGGAASNRAVQVIAAGLFGGSIEVPNGAEYVALGAARQAAASVGVTCSGWKVAGPVVEAEPYDPAILARFQQLVLALEAA